MKPAIKFIAFLIIGLFVIISCKKEKALQQQINKPPYVYAGADQTIKLPTDSPELSGNGTDSDGNIESYLWIKLVGPSQYYHIFGNSENEFTIETNDTGLDNGIPINVIYQVIQDVPKNNNITMEIIY